MVVVYCLVKARYVAGLFASVLRWSFQPAGFTTKNSNIIIFYPT